MGAEMIEKFLTILRLTLSCQSGRTFGALAASIALAALPPAAVAGSASWAHQAGALQSNGAVTVKSLSGGSYAGTQNPTGAVAKANQNAATQPPTVIIQATSSGLPFNYKDDCYIFFPPTGAGYTEETSARLGIGKIDASNKFTGISGGHVYAKTALLGASLGSPMAQVAILTLIPQDASTFWGQTAPSGGSYIVDIASNIPVRSPSKCYP